MNARRLMRLPTKLSHLPISPLVTLPSQAAPTDDGGRTPGSSATARQGAVPCRGWQYSMALSETQRPVDNDPEASCRPACRQIEPTWSPRGFGPALLGQARPPAGRQAMTGQTPGRVGASRVLSWLSRGLGAALGFGCTQLGRMSCAARRRVCATVDWVSVEIRRGLPVTPIVGDDLAVLKDRAGDHPDVVGDPIAYRQAVSPNLQQLSRLRAG